MIALILFGICIVTIVWAACLIIAGTWEEVFFDDDDQDFP